MSVKSRPTRVFARLPVKILRPDIEAKFKKDLGSFYLAARLVEWLAPPLRRLRPVAIVDTAGELGGP